MKAVWKYPLDYLGEAGYPGAQPVSIPDRAVVRHVAMQVGFPTLWIEVEPDPDDHAVTRRFTVIGTGHRVITDDMAYVGTCFDGPFVWHVYEVVA